MAGKKRRKPARPGEKAAAAGRPAAEIRPEMAATGDRQAAMLRDGPFDTLAALLSLLIIYAALLSKFDLGMLFSDTILTGGDSASWYQVLHTLKTDFLPRGRLFGYSQANFFGYMEGQQYFLPPFLFAALLGFLMPLTVALKLATFLGGFALPMTTFIAATRISGRKRVGIVASAASLAFLFNESYSIFGGNWLSTFAGEFCYSWAIAILPLFVASVVRDWRRGRRGIVSGILLGLIGLCHLFVFMPAFFLPFFEAFGCLPELLGRRRAGRGAKRGEAGQDLPGRVSRIAVTYVSAFLLMAFWVVPMAATREWAQPISMIWRFSSFGEFAGQTLLWIWAPSAIFFLAAALLGGRGSRARRLAAFFLYSLMACAFLFVISPGLGMPDIRFVPAALFLCLMGLPCVAGFLREGSGKRAADFRARRSDFAWTLAAFCAVIIICAVSMSVSKNSGGWFSWNYSGYEAKAEWPSMVEIGRQFRGTADDGRFLWEKQDQRDNRDFGSERAFENMALFTGHPSSEGIHYGSSMMARAATFLQSSYSLNPADPEAERIYSVVDPSSWPARFNLLNARYIVTYSGEIGSLFAAHSGFERKSVIGKFSVFEFKDCPGHYVEPLPPDSVSIVASGPGSFRTDYYRFFREYELYPRPFVSSEFADASLEARQGGTMRRWGNYDEYRNFELARMALEGGTGSPAAPGTGKAPAPPTARVSNEHIDNFTVRFDTDSPGAPHLIKISYAPGWKSRQGEKLYPVSPGFILMYPSGAHVELEYGRTPAEIAGIVLTLLLAPAVFAIMKMKPKRAGFWKILGSLAFIVFLASAACLFLLAFRGYPALSKDIGQARLLDLSDKVRRGRALELVEPWANAETLSRFDNMLVFDAIRIKARILQEEGKPAGAKELLSTLRAWYPHTRALPGLPGQP